MKLIALLLLALLFGALSGVGITVAMRPPTCTVVEASTDGREWHERLFVNDEEWVAADCRRPRVGNVLTVSVRAGVESYVRTRLIPRPR